MRLGLTFGVVPLLVELDTHPQNSSRREEIGSGQSSCQCQPKLWRRVPLASLRWVPVCEASVLSDIAVGATGPPVGGGSKRKLL